MPSLADLLASAIAAEQELVQSTQLQQQDVASREAKLKEMASVLRQTADLIDPPVVVPPVEETTTTTPAPT